MTRPVASWLSTRDPGRVGLARGLRVVVVGPSLFWFGLEVIEDPAFATAAIFGAFGALVFSDFGGPPWPRARAYLMVMMLGGLVLGGSTLVAGSTIVSTVAIVVVGFVVRFSGNFGPRWAAAVSPMILACALGVLVPIPGAELPGRIAGWVVSVGIAAIAAAVIMPGRLASPVSQIGATVARRMAAALRTIASGRSSEARARMLDDVTVARAELNHALVVPVRPSGPAANDVARRQILDRLARLVRLVRLAADGGHQPVVASTRRLAEADAQCLDAVAAVLEGSEAAEVLDGAIDGMDNARGAMLAEIESAIAAGRPAAETLDRVESGFVERAGAWHAETIARNVAFLRRHSLVVGPFDLRSDVPESSARGLRGRLARLVGVHRLSSSVWLRDALRAGIALGIAVVVAKVLDVDHGFWVALGTLSVLRSSALATGQTALSAAAGTGVGFAVSSGLLALVGLNSGWLWALFIVGVFAAAYVPQVLGFFAGQVTFTIFVVALFNLVVPEGWHTGLARLEDVVLGAAVSALVALLFWPRQLEPLVAELVRQQSVAVASLVDHTFTDAWPEDEWRSERDEVVAREERSLAGLGALIVQHRHLPASVDPWSSRVGVATHARSVCDALMRDRMRYPRPLEPAAQTALHIQHDAAIRLGSALGLSPDAHPDPAGETLARTIATSTRASALDAIAAGRTLPGPALRVVLSRNWLIALAHLVDDRA